MYIKQVIIQGFRSYKDQTIVEPFSPRHNVIVGRNGSGKSNFFFAIQFVLSDEFSHMRPEERQQLLHEGTGPRVVSAFVEIIFDNSDNRIPIEREEVSLRRAIGAKRDAYYLDKKHVTKNDVMNLLEGAGFSRSNPYYIVKQGKINQLAIAPDSQRLKLLREVAGTRVYDDRKEESLGILKETEVKKAKIGEMLEYIEERLSTLEEEKEELKAYQDLDKMRRSLEYTIHDKELRDTREKLEKLDATRQGNTQDSRELHEKVAAAQAKIDALERDIRDIGVSLASLSGERTQLQEEHQDMIKRRAQMEFSVKDLEQNVSDDMSNKVRLQTELSQLESDIANKESELQTLLPQYQQQRDQEERLTARLKACEQRRSELFAKQGRVQQFSTRQDRDKWINKEITSLQQSAAQKEQQIHQLEQDVNQLKIKVDQQKIDIASKTSSLEAGKVSLDRLNGEYAELKIKRDELMNERKDLWRSESTIDQSLQNTRDELNKYERNLRGSMGKATSNGLDSVRRVVQDCHLKGVYGPLIDNFTCEPRMFTAVEVTAGKRLFNIIVDNDQTATKIFSYMKKHKMPGEVTFLPLTRLQQPHVKYPNTREAVPLSQQLQYNPMYSLAILTVFGKTLVCRDMEKATQFARSANMDCITLDGDQVSYKGSLTGGYYDTRRSKLEQQRMILEMKSKLEEEENERSSLRQRLQDLEGRITRVIGDIQQAETKQIQLREGFERQKLELRNVTTEHQSNKRQLEPKERHLLTQQSDLEAVKASITALQAELGTELLSQLNPRDQKEVERLGNEIQSLQEQQKDTFSIRTDLENHKNTIENLLSSNLLRRKEQIRQDLEELTLTDAGQQLNLLSAEFKQLTTHIESTKSRMEDVESQIDSQTKRLKEMKSAHDKWRTTEREQQEAISEESKSMEKLANKRSLLLKKKEESMRRIRELGSLPSDAFDKYQGLALSQLWKKLERCNTDLKKYSHVNKKALDQFMNFSDQKEKLISRKDELDRAYDSIVELIDVLEQRKHEAIQFTFKQVSKNFSEVFKELVPHGHGQLIMKRAVEEMISSQESEEDSSSAATPMAPPPDQFSGVSIRVSFTGQSSEMKELQQLSGGQKSLVALAMIFAIQKCDPAPFYLFDEIDQALDSQHRHAVAAMIQRLSDNAQFITTTFRAELLEPADKCYGVQFRNKVSYIDVVSKEKARDFIETETADK